MVLGLPLASWASPSAIVVATPFVWLTTAVVGLRAWEYGELSDLAAIVMMESITGMTVSPHGKTSETTMSTHGMESPMITDPLPSSWFPQKA
jgi:hypothetical protein